MSSTTPVNEKWWERLPRIVGGWGFAILIFFKFPFPEAHMEDGELVHMDPGLLPWSIYVGLILFSIGVAHSTVVGIVLGNLTRAWSFVRRGGKDRRDSTADAERGGTQLREVSSPLPKGPRRRSDSGHRKP